MSTVDARVKAEINAAIDRMKLAGLPIEARWIAHEIAGTMNSAISGDGDEADTLRHALYRYLRDLTNKVFKERFADDSDGEPKQLVFPGFAREHVRDYYLIKRGGTEVAVQVDLMTDDEIDAYRERLYAHARTEIAHADELARFKEWRRENLPLEGAAS